MTIVLAVISPESVVMASDSATTQRLPTTDGELRTASIWNSANKIINLRKTWPIGAMTFGRATVQGRPITSHCKDLRGALTGTIALNGVEALSRDDYTVEQVANAVCKYFRELYDREPGGVLGFIVCGFDGDRPNPELWQVEITDAGEQVNQELPPGEAGVFHQGMTDAVTRLVDGASQGLGTVLASMNVPSDQAEPAAEEIRQRLGMPVAWSGMPLGESIDLARFLVESTIGFVRFTPGDAMVGGPVEIAALTKHEGFKWVQRKHYYPSELNQYEDVS